MSTVEDVVRVLGSEVIFEVRGSHRLNCLFSSVRWNNNQCHGEKLWDNIKTLIVEQIIPQNSRELIIYVKN